MKATKSAPRAKTLKQKTAKVAQSESIKRLTRFRSRMGTTAERGALGRGYEETNGIAEHTLKELLG